MPSSMVHPSAEQEPYLLRCCINGKQTRILIAPDTTLFELLRDQGYASVKCGCESSNCGLCTVWIEGRPVLSCSVLAAQTEGKEITTLEFLQAEAASFGNFLADEGGEQCGYCIPGMVMNVLALARSCKARQKNASNEEIKDALLGNLCRCSGYQVHMRAIRRYLDAQFS